MFQGETMKEMKKMTLMMKGEGTSVHSRDRALETESSATEVRKRVVSKESDVQSSGTRLGFLLKQATRGASLG